MTAEETIYVQKALLRRQDWRIAELESEKEKVAIRATGEIVGLREQVRVLRGALQSLVDHGKPLRGDGELWSNWQPRVKEWEEARAALAQTEPKPTP